MTIRQQIEYQEHRRLNPLAAFADQSKGRPIADEPDENDVRTCYQRDGDRIVHSKAFRRLMHKTQVFLQPEGDHYRTRMTHTLEVARIARTMARGLRLNEDLTVPPLPALIPHAETVLREAMARGCKNYIYTNRGDFLFQYLDFFGIHDCFTDFIIEAKKPNPASLLAMIERHGLNPSECVVVGDRAIDVEGGRRAGVDGILFNPIGRVKEHCAKFVIRELSELYRFLPNAELVLTDVK